MLENISEATVINLKYYSTIATSLLIIQILAIEVKNTINKLGAQQTENISKETKTLPTVFFTLISIFVFLLISEKNLDIYPENIEATLIAISACSFTIYFLEIKARRRKTTSRVKTITFTLAFITFHHSILLQIPLLSGMKEITISNLSHSTYELSISKASSEETLLNSTIPSQKKYKHLMAAAENSELIITANPKNNQFECFNMIRVPLNGSIELEIHESDKEIHDIADNTKHENVAGITSCKVI